jgi:hypothetical protein
VYVYDGPLSLVPIHHQGSDPPG